MRGEHARESGGGKEQAGLCMTSMATVLVLMCLLGFFGSGSKNNVSNEPLYSSGSMFYATLEAYMVRPA